MLEHMEIILKDNGNDALYHFSKEHVNTTTDHYGKCHSARNTGRELIIAPHNG